MGNKLRDMREKKGLTISKLARMSGVSRLTIYKLETNQSYMAASRTLVKLANAMHVPVDEIFFTESA